ncbi:hypothetical protein FGIG_05502 [Fasciola gigantica]|uniref:Uncharacterized protein n=1 Tax=Fasciola gigantica TaxID=46835 RepID=A0A504YFX8_FASGI|nr:hypothetical protein FGIG_05502 [Fasciola gigantica]
MSCFFDGFAGESDSTNALRVMERKLCDKIHGLRCRLTAKQSHSQIDCRKVTERICSKTQAAKISDYKQWIDCARRQRMICVLCLSVVITNSDRRNILENV